MNILIPTVSPESVEALVFDLGGVLLDVQLQRTLRAFEALDIRGLGAAEVIDGNRACFRDLELGLITQEEFAEAVRRTFPAVAAIPDEQLLEAWNAMLMPFDAQRVELLRELGKRCPVYLLSNTASASGSRSASVSAGASTNCSCGVSTPTNCICANPTRKFTGASPGRSGPRPENCSSSTTTPPTSPRPAARDGRPVT